MIPVSHLSKMGIYDVQIGGVEVKARVINDGKVLSAALGELECDGAHPIVGLDVKECSKFLVRRRCALLILCTCTKCLIIQLEDMRRRNRIIPEALTAFLRDERVCFVCPNGFLKRVRGLSFRYGVYQFKCKEIGAVEVGQYAARILKNPQLLKCKSLEKLGTEAEVDIISSSGNARLRSPRWDSEVFSQEDVRCVMHDAVACYRIVDKLLQFIYWGHPDNLKRAGTVGGFWVALSLLPIPQEPFPITSSIAVNFDMDGNILNTRQIIDTLPQNT